MADAKKKKAPAKKKTTAAKKPAAKKAPMKQASMKQAPMKQAEMKKMPENCGTKCETGSCSNDMMGWIQENTVLAVLGGVVLIAIIFWLFG